MNRRSDPHLDLIGEYQDVGDLFEDVLTIAAWAVWAIAAAAFFHLLVL